MECKQIYKIKNKLDIECEKERLKKEKEKKMNLEKNLKANTKGKL